MEQLWYKESGDPSGPTLVMLHGLFASTHNWQSVVKRLNHRFHIFNIDLPNHGNSPHTESMDYGEMAQMVVNLIRHLGLESAHLIGHSMGGKVAMIIALHHGALVKSLVVEDIAPKGYPPWFANVMQAMKALPLNEIKNRLDADRRLEGNIEPATLRAFLLTNLERDQVGFRWRVHLEALMRGGPNIASFPLPENGETYGGHTLFIRGGQSPYIEDADTTIIQKLFPSADIVINQEADHWLHSREPEWFSQCIANFIDHG